MPDYTHTVRVDAAPDEAFAVLSEPANLPRYVATMVEAEAEPGDRLHVAADVEGRHEEGEARLTTDRDARTMEWSGPGHGAYHGRLQVDADGNAALVTIRIHVERDADEAEIERALAETAANVERLVAAR